MPGSTGAPFNLPYPAGTDQPFAHLDMKALAEAVATEMAKNGRFVGSTGPMLGPDYAPGDRVIWQAGSTVGAADGQGHRTVVFPIPFTSKVLSVVMTNGDATVATFFPGVFLVTLTQFKWNAVDAAGAVNAGTIRGNWFAVGV